MSEQNRSRVRGPTEHGQPRLKLTRKVRPEQDRRESQRQNAAGCHVWARLLHSAEEALPNEQRARLARTFPRRQLNLKQSLHMVREFSASVGRSRQHKCTAQEEQQDTPKQALPKKFAFATDGIQETPVLTAREPTQR
jgi:hypothetical protein